MNKLAINRQNIAKVGLQLQFAFRIQPLYLSRDFSTFELLEKQNDTNY